MNRPDGSGQFAGGWTLLVFGLLVSIWGAVMDTTGYGSVDAGDLVTKWMLFYTGGGLISAAFILFVAGWIIQAISFLPSRNEAVLTTSHPTLFLDQPASDTETENISSDVRGPTIWIILACIGAATALILYSFYGHQ